MMAKARKVYNDIPGRVEESLNDRPFQRLEVKLTPSGINKHEVKVFHKRMLTLEELAETIGE